ncbi:MAG: TetR/AcrR family transcriptional regulator [Lentisphaeria bacterium]|nr:TetR/AcrR family transcriptional regulator [Lentisphaeria bacterium]
MQERAIKTRQAILTAAIRLFARHGFQGTRVDALASAAKVNRQRLYAYFGSKEKLFETAMLAVFAQANAEDERLLQLNDDDLPRLTALLLRHYFDVHRRHPALHRMIGWANLELKHPPLSMKDNKEPSFAHLRQLYRHGQAAGFFQNAVSFDVYIFTLLAVTYFHAANRTTAAQTISSGLFAPDGADRLVLETAAMMHGQPLPDDSQPAAATGKEPPIASDGHG